MSIKAEDNITLESKKPIYDISSDTAQHFWFWDTIPTGKDPLVGTGAHISEVPESEFNDPDSPNYHAGGNLLARSNGLAVRDGLEELTRFGAQGIQVGKDDGQHIVVTPESFGVYDPDGGTPFNLVTGATKTQRETEWGYIVNANSTVTATLSLKGAVQDNRYYVSVSLNNTRTYDHYIDNPTPSGSSITVDGVTVTLIKTGSNTIKAIRANTNGSQRYVYIKVTQSFYPFDLQINQRPMVPTYFNPQIEATTGALDRAYGYTYGNIAVIRIMCHNANVPNKGRIFGGNLLNMLPIMSAQLSGISVDGFIHGELYTDGYIDIRNFTGQTITATAEIPIDVFGIYMVDDSQY